MREAVVSNICDKTIDAPAAVSEPPMSGVFLKATPIVPEGTPLPEGIPRDNAELYKIYSPFVLTTLRRYNKVGRNFEEMYAYIWKRLVEKDVLRLYLDSVAVQLPSKMTAAQVIEWLGITPQNWKTRMWRYHVGTPTYSKASLPHVKAAKVHKKLHKAAKVAGDHVEAAKQAKLRDYHESKQVVLCRRQGCWAPPMLNAQTFQMAEDERVAEARARGENPTPGLCPGHNSMEALFDTEDIMILQSMETQKEDGTVLTVFRKMQPKEIMPVKATKAHFQAYLSKSIWSDFSNWCRTFRRKFAQDKPMYLRPDNEEDADWERNLVDPGGAKQETLTIISQACTVLSKTLHKGMLELGPDSKCKPVEQTEMQMFELLEQGVPLGEVVKKLEIPDHVRRMVLRSIADIRAA